MRRVTTPKHTFTFDTDPSEWDSFRITYKQKEQTVLEKTEADIGDMTITDLGEGKYRLEYMLTQDETAKFQVGAAQVQVRCHYPSGKVPASGIFTFDVDKVFNTEILS